MLDLNRRIKALDILSAALESPVQEEARKLYDIGLNVFPQPIGKKAGFPWKKLQYTRLHRTHYKYGLHTLFADRCNLAIMCGRTSNNLFIIDCESKAQLQFHIIELRRRALPLWAVQTARGGHIYLFSDAGEVISIPPATLPDSEVRGHGYVLAPPSIHPTGVIYQWIAREGDTPPTVTPQRIDWLKDHDGQPVTLKTTGKPGGKTPAPHNPQSPLAKATRDYLKNGHTLKEGTRNNALFNTACDMAGNDFSSYDAHTTLGPIAVASGLAPVEVTRTINNAYSQSRTPTRTPTQPTPTQPNAQWQKALHYANNKTWTGRTGNSDRAVFLALIERARQASNERGAFRASIREVAALARVSRETAHKALKRLQNTKPALIARTGRDNRSEANLWRFTGEVIKRTKPANWHTDKNGLSCSVLVSGSDVVERGALGRSGMRVYRALVAAGRPLLPRRLAESAGLTVKQAEYGLRKLRQYDLVQREKAGWVAVPATDEQLEQRVALPAGTLGKGEARRRQFAAERALYAGQEIFAARVKFAARAGFGGFGLSGGGMARVERSGRAVDQAANGRGDAGRAGGDVAVWECPNCGQNHFGDDLPDMCAYCADFTTWRRVAGREDQPVDGAT